MLWQTFFIYLLCIWDVNNILNCFYTWSYYVITKTVVHYKNPSLVSSKLPKEGNASALFNHCLLSPVNLTLHLPFLIDIEFINQDKILCCSNKQLKHLSGLKQQRSIFCSCHLSPKDPGWWSSRLTWTPLVTIPEKRKSSAATCTGNHQLSQSLEPDTWGSPTSREPGSTAL